jgi:hypothetical protein
MKKRLTTRTTKAQRLRLPHSEARNNPKINVAKNGINTYCKDQVINNNILAKRNKIQREKRNHSKSKVIKSNREKSKL